MNVTMYDSVDVNAVPSGAKAIAGYVGGFWPTYSGLVARFPNALHLSIAVNASEDADILDVENGDATPSQVPVWVRRQLARGLKRPGVYASLSAWPEIDQVMRSVGMDPQSIKRWAAQWTGVAHIPAGFLACQWTDHGPNGENIDISLADLAMFNTKPVPVKNMLHYNWFPGRAFLVLGKLLSERAIVRRYDKLRKTQTPDKHPHRAQLAVLRRYLGYLAGRVYTVSHKQKVNGKPSWGHYHRGWRYQQLIHRAHGQRFV